MLILKGRKEIQNVSRKHIEKQVFWFSVKAKIIQKKHRITKYNKTLDITKLRQKTNNRIIN